MVPAGISPVTRGMGWVSSSWSRMNGYLGSSNRPQIQKPALSKPCALGSSSRRQKARAPLR
jgi:hypothetical protein